MAARLTSSATGTVTSAGTVTFTFQSVPQGQVWTGNLLVASAPPASSWIVEVGTPAAGQPWGSWNGPAPYGPVQAVARESIVVRGSGLTPGASMTVQLLGMYEYDSEAQPSWPAATAGPLSTPQPVTTAQVVNFRPAFTGSNQVTGGAFTITPNSTLTGIGGNVAILRTAADAANSFCRLNLIGQTTGRVYELANVLVATTSTTEYGHGDLNLPIASPINIASLLATQGAGTDTSVAPQFLLNYSIAGFFNATVMLVVQG